MAKKSRILLLTRDPQLEETFKAALEGDRHHVVEVREMGVLGLPATVLIARDETEVARLLGDADWASDSAKSILKALIAAKD